MELQKQIAQAVEDQGIGVPFIINETVYATCSLEQFVAAYLNVLPRSKFQVNTVTDEVYMESWIAVPDPENPSIKSAHSYVCRCYFDSLDEFLADFARELANQMENKANLAMRNRCISALAALEID